MRPIKGRSFFPTGQHTKLRCKGGLDGTYQKWMFFPLFLVMYMGKLFRVSAHREKSQIQITGVTMLGND